MSTSLPPVLVGNHITGDAAHTVIDLEFSRTIERGSGSIIITDGALQTVIDRATGLPTLRVVGATQTYQVPLSQVGIDGNHALINADNLTAGHHYSVFIAPGVLASNGMPFAGVTNAAQLSFVAVDHQAPTLSSIEIAGATPLLNANSTVTIKFSEPVHLDPAAVVAPHANISNWQTSDGITWTASLAPQSGTFATGNALTVNMALVTDNAGNAGAGVIGNPNTYTVDTQGPGFKDAMLSSSMLAIGDTATLTIHMLTQVSAFPKEAISVPGATVESIQASDDGLTWVATIKPLEGVTATDNSVSIDMSQVRDMYGVPGTGNFDIPHAYTVDTTPPNAPGVPVLDSGTDSGKFTDDAITNINPPVIHGSGAEPFARIELYDMVSDSKILLGSVSASATGTWTIDLKSSGVDGTPVVLNDGFHQLQAVQFDAGGNESLPSDELQLMIDTHANSPVISPLVSASDTGTVGDWLTAARQPTLGGIAEAGATVEVQDGGQVIGSTVADTKGAWTFAFKADLGDGVHNLSIRQTDVAGNVSEPALQALTIDATAPGALSGLVLDAGSDTGYKNNDGITKATRPLLTGAGAEANATIKLYDGEQLVGSATSHQDGTWSVAPTADLHDGVHTFCVQQVDAAGNAGPKSAGINVTIDNVAPTATGWTSSVVLGNHFEIWFSEPVVHNGLTNYADVNDNITAALFHFALGDAGSWDDNVIRDDHPSSDWHFTPTHDGWVEVELTGVQDFAGNVAIIPRVHHGFTVSLTSVLPPPLL
jgi:hypothetical protein